jgi:hypothetical protein
MGIAQNPIRASGGKSHEFGDLQPGHAILLEKLYTPDPVVVVDFSAQEEAAAQGG